MQNTKINAKKITAILIVSLILITSVACSRKNNVELNRNNTSEYNQMETNNSESNETVDTTIKVEETTIDSNKNEHDLDKEISSEMKKEETYTNNDIEVINYFDNIEKSVDDELQNENNETTKDKLKGTFITVVDFLFYDSEINGIKFDDLTEGAKKNILETATSIDNKIMTKYPNYKEEISSTASNAYQKASELIKKGANNVKEFSKEKLGEENYNAIIDAKDELVHYTKNAVGIIGDIAGSVFETGKSKIKTWYENFRN